MAQAGTIEALNSDYARTATLKGLKRSVVIRRHVLRNALLPTITVIATQTGYLIGGLVVVETLFNYQGIGNLIYKAAQSKDFPMLEAGVLTIGVVYMVATLIADVLYTVLNPRLRLGASRMTDVAAPTAGVVVARAETSGELTVLAAAAAPADVPGRRGDPGLLGGLRAVRQGDRPARPAGAAAARHQPGTFGGALVRHRPARP